MENAEVIGSGTGGVVCRGAGWTTKKKTEVDANGSRRSFPKIEQVLHALDRLTFGPRPGDVETVKKMGVKKWIDLQLHPEHIAENPELEASWRRSNRCG